MESRLALKRGEGNEAVKDCASAASAWVIQRGRSEGAATPLGGRNKEPYPLLPKAPARNPVQLLDHVWLDESTMGEVPVPRLRRKMTSEGLGREGGSA